MNENKIIFKKATVDDKNDIANVLLDFYNMKDLNEAINAFLSELDKDFHYIVAIEQDKIIGLVTWLMHGLPKHGLFELDRICILSESRSKGVGSKLVNKLVDDAKDWYKKKGGSIRKLYLLTHEDNLNAHLFYEKIGFKHESTLESHYYKGKDERVYSMFFPNT